MALIDATAHIITFSFIWIAGMWAILDQYFPFWPRYLASSKGHFLKLSITREDGSWSSGEDSKLGQLYMWSIWREVRFWSPFPSNNFKPLKLCRTRNYREVGSNCSFKRVLIRSSSLRRPLTKRCDREVRCWNSKPNSCLDIADSTRTST